MKFSEMVEKVQGTVVVDNPEAEISSAYCGDLLSDVMGHCGDESVLITVRTTSTRLPSARSPASRRC